MPSDSIAKRVAQWRDAKWWASELLLPVSLRMRRPQRMHWFRWEDDLRRLAGMKGWSHWSDVAAADPDLWKASIDVFAGPRW